MRQCNRMQKLVAIAVALVCAFSLSACHTKERRAKNLAAGDQWLGSFNQPAELKVTGTWASLEWGEGSLKQTGRKVTGTLGNYAVNGVVSGSKVYLQFLSDNWVYYSAVLERTPAGVLSGHYSEGTSFDPEEQEPITLKRW